MRHLLAADLPVFNDVVLISELLLLALAGGEGDTSETIFQVLKTLGISSGDSLS